PTIACSSGAATVSAITLGFAPGYEACTTTCGGTTSGDSLIGSLNKRRRPAMVMNAEMTPAKIGRSMKKSDNDNFTDVPHPLGQRYYQRAAAPPRHWRARTGRLDAAAPGRGGARAAGHYPRRSRRP